MLSAGLASAAFLAALVSIAWLPAAAVRGLGALFLGLLGFVLLRPALGLAQAACVALPLSLAGWRWAPTLVLRRLSFVLPSLVFLIFATTLLMYLAPGNPFAQENVASPQVEAA